VGYVEFRKKRREGKRGRDKRGDEEDVFRRGVAAEEKSEGFTGLKKTTKHKEKKGNS